jgi:DNA polymerase beta
LTGDDELYRYMRKKAERQGMLLDEYGLWRWNTSAGSSTEGLEGPSSSIEASGSPEPVEAPDEEVAPDGYWGLVATPTEEAVFKELGMRYIPPEKRNWGFVSGTAKLRPTKKKFSTSFVGS